MLGWGFCGAGLRENMPRGGQAFGRAAVGNLNIGSPGEILKSWRGLQIFCPTSLNSCHSEQGPRNDWEERDRDPSLPASSPLSYPVSCTSLGEGPWGSSGNPGTTGSQERMRASALQTQGAVTSHPEGLRAHSTLWPWQG